MKTEALKALDTALWRARAAAVRTSDHHIQIGHAIDAFYQLKEALAQPEQEPTNDWSEWRGMVVQNLMRHGIDKDFARRLAHFYQDKAPQPKEPEQRSVSEHLEPVAWLQIGVGPLHEGDVIARTTKPKEWNPEWWKFEPLYTTPPQRKPLTEWQPIETAPKNSTSILIYCPRSERKPVCEAWWAIAYEGDRGGHWQTPIGPNGRGYTILETAPTHWMPLPPPPIEAAHGIKE